MIESYVEDIEKGSIKWWLRDKLYKLDDNAIEKFVDKPFKTTLAGVLKHCKYKGYRAFRQRP